MTVRKGTNRVCTNGVSSDAMFFDRGTCWVLPLTYVYLPKSARAYLFPNMRIPPLKFKIMLESGPLNSRILVRRLAVHPVSITRFPSFRTQPLENLSVDSVNKWIPEQPSPWRKSCYGDRVYRAPQRPDIRPAAARS